jgi:hypothetical protein
MSECLVRCAEMLQVLALTRPQQLHQIASAVQNPVGNNPESSIQCTHTAQTPRPNMIPISLLTPK